MTTLETPDANELKPILIGRKIIKAEKTGEFTGELTLDNGEILKVAGNEGGCTCSSGDYPLEVLNTCENAITNVVVENNPADYDGWYRVFVFSADEKIALAPFEGGDGNGYYGTGWWLTISAS